MPQATEQTQDNPAQANPTAIFAALTAAGLDPRAGFQCVPATYLLPAYHPVVEVELPLVITGCTPQTLARLSAILQNAYPHDHAVTILAETRVTTGATGEVAQATLATVATIPWFAETALLCVPPLPAGSSFSALQAIVAHLRSPAGCPWDRKQTLLTMRKDLLGECAEVIEAIDLDSAGDNGDHIAEELGDLCMAAVLMVQIATDAGRFQMAAAMQSIVTKLIRRHPHVFADVAVDGVETVVANWDAIKAQEKAAKGERPGHPLDGVPATLPALERARELQAKATKAGLLERAALVQAEPRLAAWASSPLDEAELGELLWQIVALAHRADLNAEDALRSYLTRFRAQQE
ncbi:MAG: MazG family protein [Caldilineaceae bacterium]|nr:MazG family protein [Caldilineaceae bacterium]